MPKNRRRNRKQNSAEQASVMVEPQNRTAPENGGETELQGTPQGVITDTPLVVTTDMGTPQGVTTDMPLVVTTDMGTPQGVTTDTPLVVTTDMGTPQGVTTDTPLVVTRVTSLRSLAQSLTLEHVLYVLLAILALLLRVASLDARPLTPGEAQTAAAAWEFLNGATVGAYASPLLFTLNWLAFFLFGASDFTARLLPAALSALLVLVPALARSALGKTGALLAALLIAFSPTTVFLARNVAAADLAAGAALGALILFWHSRANKSTRRLNSAAILAALSLTADAVAFTLLFAGALYFAIAYAAARRHTPETESENEQNLTLAHPFVRAVLFFAAAYVLSATTFLLNRDGLGVAFNVLGEWFNAFTRVGDFVAPLIWLLVYEPLSLIFGLAALVLVFTLREEHDRALGLLRLLSFVSVFTFVFYSLAGNIEPSILIAIALPLMLLAGWFIGNLLERAREDIANTGGWRTTLAGEIPIFAMLILLAALVYVQIATFLQQARFSPALEVVYGYLNASSGQPSLSAAALTLLLITFLLLVVFIGLSILLVGVSRTTTLLAFAILTILAVGMLRAMWLLNFPSTEPLRELAAPSQTPLQMRDLVRDLEFYSLARHGDSHVIRIAANPELGAAGRWYLRDFPNLVWTNQIAASETAQAVLTSAETPPPGNWMGQRFRVQTTWQLAGADGIALWKWFVYREGGTPSAQTTMLWLPTQE